MHCTFKKRIETALEKKIRNLFFIVSHFVLEHPKVKKRTHTAAAADKVIGKATALLYALLGVQAVYARVASQPAATVLAQQGITLVCDQIVPYIQNRSGTGMCPMEEATRDIFQPEQALVAIRKRLSELRNENNG